MIPIVLTPAQLLGFWGLVVSIISVALLIAEPRFTRKTSTTKENRHVSTR